MSRNCLQICLGTVSKWGVGELSCRETVLIPNSLDIHRYLTFLRRKYTDLPFFELKENNIQNILPFLLYFKLILNSTRDLRKKKKKSRSTTKSKWKCTQNEIAQFQFCIREIKMFSYLPYEDDLIPNSLYNSYAV